MATAPVGPAEPMGDVGGGPDDERNEQTLDLVAGELYEAVRCGAAGDPAGPGCVAADLVLVQGGQALSGLEELLDSPPGPSDSHQHGQGHRFGRVAAVVGEFAGTAVAADQELATAGSDIGEINNGPVVEAVALCPGPGGQLTCSRWRAHTASPPVPGSSVRTASPRRCPSGLGRDEQTVAPPMGVPVLWLGGFTLGRARDRRDLPSLGASVRRSGPTARGSCCTCFTIAAWHDRYERAHPAQLPTRAGMPRRRGTSSDPEPVQQPLVVHRRPAEQQLRGLGPSEVQVGRVFPSEADAAVDLDVLHGGDHVRP